MYKWILAAVISLSVLASITVIKFGLKPKAVPIIKPSNFEDPVQLGNYIHRQLYQRLLNSKPIVFGLNGENAYETKVVDSLIDLMKQDVKGSWVEVLRVNPKDSLNEKFGDNALEFTVINLTGTAEASELKNCEFDHTYPVWLECVKAQKVRQINRARKVNLQKPVGIVETQSQRDIIIYIRE